MVEDCEREGEQTGKEKKSPNYFGLIKNHHGALQKAIKRLWFTRKVNPVLEEPVASMPTRLLEVLLMRESVTCRTAIGKAPLTRCLDLI